MRTNGGVHPEPEHCYTDHTILNLLPELDTFM